MYNLLSNAKLLIIDDFAQFRATIKTMLYKLGAANTDQASNAVEAMKRCLQTDYDIIFCDYNLGDGQDGQQFLEELQQRHMLLKGTLFLMVTAESTSAQVMGAIEYRPDAYLTKPFTNEQLGQRLKRLLQRNAHLKPIHQAINQGANQKAIALCDALMQKIPNLRFSCQRLKADLLEQQKKYDELGTLYRQVIDEQPLLWAELGLGKIHFAQGDYNAALQQFCAMRDSHPQQVSILDWIAKCQRQLGQTEEAEATLRQAIQISPKSVSRQATLGEVAQSLEHHEIAQQAFQKTLEEGYHSCQLKAQHYSHYFENTRKIACTLGGYDQNMLLARTEAVAKKMERRFRQNPAGQAANLSSMAAIFASCGKDSQAESYASRLTKTLKNPQLRINEEEHRYITDNLQAMGDNAALEKQLQSLDSRMTELKDQVERDKINDKSARKINRAGMNLARDNQPQPALEKFREAIRLMPHNPNYKLNAAQIIMSNEGMSTDAEHIDEARAYLDAISLENTGKRWRLYKKLKEMLPDD